MSESRIHQTAARGFEAAAGAYARARPDYPAAAIDWVVEALGVGGDPDAVVCDLAAGTGKFTAGLVARGVRCVAVEPVAAMRRALTAVVPQVWAFNGSAEDIPLADESLAGVTVAQAFHWFDGSRAAAEIHRVLRPGARLAVVWNVRDERTDWVRRISEIIEPFEGEVRIPRYRDGAWRAPLEREDLFALCGAREFAHAQTLTPESLVERVASVSFVAVLSEEERARVLGSVRELAATHPDLRGRREFSHPYLTEAYVFERLSGPC
ncbi:MAG: methyltransferase domain-containing protein [Actinomycetota bacterium]